MVDQGQESDSRVDLKTLSRRDISNEDWNGVTPDKSRVVCLVRKILHSV